MVFVLVSPVAALVAACWSATHLLRTEQLTALTAAGIGPKRALVAFVVVGGCWASFSWMSAEFLAPVGLESWSRDGPTAHGSRWVRDDDHLYFIGAVARGEVGDILIFELDETGLPLERIEAQRAELVGGSWILHDVRISAAGSAPRRLERRASPVPLRFAGGLGSPQELTGPALSAAARDLRETGGDDAPLTAERGLRASLALACLVCTIFGLVIGVRTGRRAELTAALTAVVGLAYWLVISACWTLASSGALPSWAVVAAPTLGMGAVASGFWMRL